MIFPIVLYGDPVLKRRGSDVEVGDEKVESVVSGMFETMYAAQGVGLAAPQIGESLRVFVIDTEPMEEDAKNGVKQAFINPIILEQDGKPWAFEEGCLSIPGIREEVSRQPKIKVRFFDEYWTEHEKEFDGMAARVIQHEHDHIEGKLFTDYLTPLKRRLLKSKLANISKGKTDVEYQVRIPN